MKVLIVYSAGQNSQSRSSVRELTGWVLTVPQKQGFWFTVQPIRQEETGKYQPSPNSLH